MPLLRGDDGGEVGKEIPLSDWINFVVESVKDTSEEIEVLLDELVLYPFPGMERTTPVVFFSRRNVER
jgi:hypothetical protein